jgi:hypothetical protein
MKETAPMGRLEWLKIADTESLRKVIQGLSI